MPLTFEQFTTRLAESGILSDEQVREFIATLSDDSPGRTNADELAHELVRQKKLTKFQAEQIYAGKGSTLILGNYVILDKLGQGGMGMVLKAEHKRMKRRVAIKVMSPAAVKTPDALKRFHREVEAAAKLRHPNIVAADDADEAKGTHFLVMEYVEGSDLSVLVKKNGPFTVDKAVRYIIQAARGLEYAHEQGIVHRDIKPANLLLDSKGTVKILDMGLARIDDSVGGSAEGAGLTSTGTIMGTVDYMSPEQAMDTKQADARSDIYSLGCSLYYLLTGRSLFDGDTIMKKLIAHREGAIPDLESSPFVPRQKSHTSVDAGLSTASSEVDGASAFVSRSDTANLKALTAVFQRMVAKKPQDRPQTMTQVIAELERCLSGGSPTVAIQPNSNTTTSVLSVAIGNQRQDFPPEFSGGESLTATSAGPTGVKGTVVSPSSGEAATMISSAGVAGTDPRTEQTVTLEQVGHRFGEPMGVSPRTARGLTPSGSPSQRMKLLIGSVAAVVVLVAILFVVSGNRGEKESPRSKAEVAKGGGDVPSRGDSSASPSQPVKDPDRDVAKWVIETGGSVNVQMEGKPASRVTTVPELPKERFVVESVAIVRQSSLTAADVERLVVLPKLSGIVLELTPPTADAVRAMKNLRDLRYVSLIQSWDNRPTDEALVALTELRQLDAVHLSLVHIPDEFFARVGQLPRLRDLVLYGARPLSAAQFELLAANPPMRLRTLDLRSTPMTQAGLAAVARLPHLFRLDLGRSNLDDDMLSALHSSKSLSIVHVHETAVSREGTDRLVAANGVCVVADPASLPSHINAEYWQTAQTLLSRGFGFSTGEHKTYPPGSTLPPQAEPITNVSVPDSATLDDLKSLATLKGISVFYGPLPADALQLLEPLSNLTSLNPGSLTSGDISRLKNFPKLQDLTAAFPNDEAVATIASLPHLLTLDLGPQSQITDACLTSLRDAPNLTRLHCSLPITRAAIESFVTARPDVDVVWNGETFNASAPEALTAKAVAPFDAKQARAHQEAWAKHLGVPVEYTNPIGMKMVLIPPGEFWMGSPDEEINAVVEAFQKLKWDTDVPKWESPRHRVTISEPFFVSATELTRGQFRQFAEQASYKTEAERGAGGTVRENEQFVRKSSVNWRNPGIPFALFGSDNSDDVPVLQVTWNDAGEFCRWLSDFEQSIPSEKRTAPQIPVAYGLPSEAQWEYACRAGTETAFWYGDLEAKGTDEAMYHGGSIVAHKRPNPFGLYDMHGNAAEWCLDCLTPDYYKTSPAVDPVAPPISIGRITRGGSGFNSPLLGRSGSRSGAVLDVPTYSITFRVIRKLTGLTASRVNGLNPAPPPANAPFKSQQARMHQEAWARHLGVPVEYTNSIGMKFRLIPPGEFLMGSPPADIEAMMKWADEHKLEWMKPGIPSEGPQHAVKLTTPFFLGVTEVTQEQYERVMGTNPSFFAKTGSDPKWVEIVAGLNTSDHPVEGVTWAETAEFCNKLSQREQLSPSNFQLRTTARQSGGIGYRLPTEAEWEFACRAGTTTRLWSGDNNDDHLHVGWGSANSNSRTNSVGQLKANPFGLFDVHGNVYEWVQDGWTPFFYKMFADEIAVDPFNPGQQRCARGGDSFGDALSNRCARRHSDDPTRRHITYGFRAALSVDAVRQTHNSKPSNSTTPSIENSPATAVAPFDARQARAHQEAWAKHLGTTVETTNSIGVKMVLIPPGEFLMGSNDEQIKAAGKIADETQEPSLKSRIAEERPQHHVRITKPFRLGAHEVTIGQFAKFIDHSKYKTQAEEFGGNSEVVRPEQVKPDNLKLTWRSPGHAVTDDSPVTQVNWNDAVAFCNWLSEQESLPRCYQREGDSWSLVTSANGYRLPTEAEWEYCCRAGTTTQFSFGDDWKGMDPFGWSKNNASGRPQSVGLRSANPFGLFDMHGNVWEWCHDGYDAKWYENSPPNDPTGPSSSLRRVDRGGSWGGVPAFARSAFRISSNLTYRYDDRGFRIVKVLITPATT